MAGGNIMSRWSGEIHPNGEVALSDPVWAQAISIGKVQLNNKISKMEEVLAWLIPSAAKRPQALSVFLRRPLRMQVRDVEKAERGCHPSRYWRWLDSRQVENYVNVCSNYKMQFEYINESIDKTCFFTICCLEGQSGGAIQALKLFCVFFIHLFWIYILNICILYILLMCPWLVILCVYKMPYNMSAICNEIGAYSAECASYQCISTKYACSRYSHVFV